MAILKEVFGHTKNGEQVDLYTLTNDWGMSVRIMTLGGTIVSVKVPDRNNSFSDVVLGYDDVQSYENGTTFFGALIGRHANRIGNAEFELNGKVYKLAKNNGENHLHGGDCGFDKKVWNAEVKDNSLVLTYTSPDLEENYPGTLEVRVTYTLTNDNSIEINYHAVSDKDTVVNLTNHSYFNLSGHASGTIKDHKVKIDADKFTPNDANCLPTGEIRSVEGTPMDLRTLTPVSVGLESGYEQIKLAAGYDHNFVLNVSGKKPEKFAEVYDDKTGRCMEAFTTMPGVQFYTGNFVGGSLMGKGATKYHDHDGLCLETQYFPNAMMHKNFPSPVLKAGEVYNHTTIYRFSVK